MEQSLVMEQREGCAARKAGGENVFDFHMDAV